MPVTDDVEPREFITDKISVGRQYDAYIIDVYQDTSNTAWYYVIFYLPSLKGIYQEKGKGMLVQTEGKAKKLALQFFYNVNFPGKIIEPKKKSNVSGTDAKEFHVETIDNWLGLPCRLTFKEEAGYNDPEKMYKNIKRTWDIGTDGIQGWPGGTKLPMDEVTNLKEKYLSEPEEQYSGDGDNPGEEDLPF